MSVSDLTLGSEFAGYRIEQVIGRGGMGVVYRAVDLSLERPVAIKLIADEMAGDADLRERFQREARLMAALDHPNVIPVYTAGEQDGHLYLVMRYVEGTDLQRLLRQRGHLSAYESARIVDQVGRALDAAHQRGLVHRDIKPANVLLNGDHVYLTDFGITRLIDERTRETDTGKWVGTLNYMSPEHLRGEATDELSDVYSLACLLYTCLVGTPPFDRLSPAATITAQLHDRPPRVSQLADVPRQFDQVITRGLAKAPKERYRTAGRLGTAALAAAQSGRGEGRLPRRRSRARRGADALGVGGSIADGRRGDRETDQRLTRLAPPTRRTAVVGEGSIRVLGADPVADRKAPHTVGWSGQGEGFRLTHGARWALLALVLPVVAAIAVGVLLLADSGSTTPGPLTRAEITHTLREFSTDYGNRDSSSLARLLASDVTRVDPTAAEHGRAAVLAQYEQQFRTKPLPVGYTLSDLTVTPGWAGRADARFTITLGRGGTLSGDVVFGLERVGAGVQIGLIATR